MTKLEELRYKIETYIESLFIVFIFLGELLVYIIACAWFFLSELIISSWKKLIKKLDKLLIFLSNVFS